MQEKDGPLVELPIAGCPRILGVLLPSGGGRSHLRCKANLNHLLWQKALMLLQKYHRPNDR